MNLNSTADRTVEYRLVDDEQLPPIVITMDENDEVKLIINTYYKIWLAANRKIIGGVAEGLFAKIIEILDSYLVEQRTFELMDNES